ncbi:ABC transporter ATP-binding protein [Vibrio sp. 10N.222.51.C12]|uniref:ABC transporter ATP-binding protein n=1 Tax=Vibrio sp. 10N.222.51.C12 TaxID=3229622 RepID=UPI00354F5C67
MYNSIKELYSILSKKQKKRILKLQFLVITMAVLELVSVSSIAPFMALIGDLSLLESSGPISNIYVMTGVSNPKDFVFILGIVLLLVLTISTVFSVLTVWRLSTFAYDTGTEIADRLFNYYVENDWLFHMQNNSSHLIKQIAGDSQRVTNNVLQPLLQLNAKFVLAVVLCSALVIYRWEVAVGGLVVFSIAYILLFKVVRSRLDNNGKLISKLTEERYKIMSEVFGGIKELLLMGRRDNAKRNFKNSGIDLAKCQGINTAIGSTPRYIMELIAFGSIISLLLYLYSKYDGNISEILPVISLCALAGFKLLPAFQTIYTSIAQIRGNIAAFDAIKHDMLASKDFESIGDGTGSNNLGNIKDIELDNVVFSYPGSRKPSLNKISFKIEPQTTVAFVGASGAGKTTLIDMILGLLEPHKGKMVVSGTVMNQHNKRNWQDKIGYVPQSIFLTEGSILQNVAFGLDDCNIDVKKVRTALNQAELLNYVDGLPDGLETNVGERGVKLSGGQRQRIGIARALYHDPEVLVFDEATSALDGITEKTIMDAINLMGDDKTIIIIAHRLKTIENADVIYYLDKGLITDQGTYDDLLNKNKFFRKMADHA